MSAPAQSPSRPFTTCQMRFPSYTNVCSMHDCIHNFYCFDFYLCRHTHTHTCPSLSTHFLRVGHDNVRQRHILTLLYLGVATSYFRRYLIHNLASSLRRDAHELLAVCGVRSRLEVAPGVARGGVATAAACTETAAASGSPLPELTSASAAARTLARAASAIGRWPRPRGLGRGRGGCLLSAAAYAAACSCLAASAQLVDSPRLGAAILQPPLQHIACCSPRLRTRLRARARARDPSQLRPGVDHAALAASRKKAKSLLSIVFFRFLFFPPLPRPSFSYFFFSADQEAARPPVPVSG